MRLGIWALALCLAVPGTARTSEWRVDESASRIGFVASYDGVSFAGTFERWQAAITFTPGSVPVGSMRIEVGMASVNTRSRDRDKGMQGEDWFWSRKFPLARFIADDFERRDGHNYAADATLSIKTRNVGLEIPFTWRLDGNAVRLQGELEVDRRDFDIGVGEWVNDGLIGFSVKIVYDLRLRAENPP